LLWLFSGKRRDQFLHSALEHTFRLSYSCSRYSLGTSEPPNLAIVSANFSRNLEIY